jgi:hypothetical protein
MKGFMYAYAIGTSHIDKKVNAFKIKDLEKKCLIMASNLKKMKWREVAHSKTSCIN